MSKIFKPRRAVKSSTKTSSGVNKDIILQDGEMMLIKDDTNPSMNNVYDLYMGDGVTTIENLAPSISGTATGQNVTVINDTSATASSAIGNIVSGKSIGQLVGSIKQALSKILTEKANVNHTHSNYAASTHTHDDRYTRINNNATFSNEVRIMAASTATSWMGPQPRINLSRTDSPSPMMIEGTTNTGMLINSPTIWFENRSNANGRDINNSYFINSRVHITNADSNNTGHGQIGANANGLDITRLDNNNVAANTQLFLYKKQSGQSGVYSKTLTEANFTLDNGTLYINTSL